MGYDFDQQAVPAVNQESCTQCGQCVATCPTETLVLEGGKVTVGPGNFMGCIGCGHCMLVCPTGSITVAGRGLSPDDVVELPAAESRATADQFDAMLLARRSVRRFEDREVDRPLVERILEMIAAAPVGIPPSDVGIVVFHGRDKVREFAEDTIASFRKAIRSFRSLMFKLMRPLIGKAQYALIRDFVGPVLEGIVKDWDQGRDEFAYEAPLAMLFHGPQVADADLHIAATYGMLAAQSLGLGSCMLGTTAALDHDAGFKTKYGIPQENKINLGLVMGYPGVRFRQAVRRKLASVTFA